MPPEGCEEIRRHIRSLGEASGGIYEEERHPPPTPQASRQNCFPASSQVEGGEPGGSRGSRYRKLEQDLYPDGGQVRLDVHVLHHPVITGAVLQLHLEESMSRRRRDNDSN